MTTEGVAILILLFGAIFVVVGISIAHSRRSHALLREWAAREGLTIHRVRSPALSSAFLADRAAGFSALFHIFATDAHGNPRQAHVLFQHVFWGYSDTRVKIKWG